MGNYISSQNCFSAVPYYKHTYKKSIRQHIIAKNTTTYQGRSQEFSFTEAILKGKGASNAGGLGGAAPQKLTQYISHFQYFVEQL